MHEYTNTSTKTYFYAIILVSDSAGQAYLFNTHGDVIRLIGTLTWTYTYDAYGVQKNPDPLDGNAFRYAGQYFDTESGTYYLRARYYNPTTGRFTQQDAWANANRGDPLGLNLYLYCNCNPVRYFDPSGELAWWILALLTLGVMMMAGCSNSDIYSKYGDAFGEGNPIGYGYHNNDFNSSALDAGIHDAIENLWEGIGFWRDNNQIEASLQGDVEFGIFVYQAKNNPDYYYSGRQFSNVNHSKVISYDPYKGEDGIPIIFIHTHPHDNNENIFWNSDEIKYRRTNILYMLLAYNEEKQMWAIYYFPQHGTTVEDTIQVYVDGQPLYINHDNIESVSYNIMWGTP